MVSACRAQLLKFWSKVMLYGSVTAFVLFSLVAFFWIFRCAVAVCIVVSRVVVRLSERATVVGGLGFTSVCVGSAGMFLVSYF